MNASIFDVTNAMRRWFAHKNIAVDSLTVILNFTDGKAASRFERALERELAPLRMPSDNLTELSLYEYRLQGIKIKLESPVHDAD